MTFATEFAPALTLVLLHIGHLDKILYHVIEVSVNPCPPAARTKTILHIGPLSLFSLSVMSSRNLGKNVDMLTTYQKLSERMWSL